MTTKKVKNKNQLKCKWVILCNSSSIDNETNTLSMSNIIEEITIKLHPDEMKTLGEPKVLPLNFDLIAMWERVNGFEGRIETNIELQFIDPDGNILMGGSKSAILMEDHHRRFRTRYKIGGLKCSKPGVYTFRMVCDESEKVGVKIACEESVVVKMFDPNGEELHKIPE